MCVREVDGLTVFSERTVILSVDAPDLPRTLVHELSHVAKGDGGGEKFIRSVELPLSRLLLGLGLSLPSLPPEYHRMRRRALARNRKAENEGQEA